MNYNLMTVILLLYMYKFVRDVIFEVFMVNFILVGKSFSLHGYSSARDYGKFRYYQLQLLR